MEEFDTERLLKLLGALIKASDSDLLNNRKCFPCKKEDHEYYKAIRDSFQIIYDEADYTCSSQFLSEVEGKSDKFVQMKSKIFHEPTKKNAHRIELLDKLCSLNTINEAVSYINVQHHKRYNQAMDNLEKCRDA